MDYIYFTSVFWLIWLIGTELWNNTTWTSFYIMEGQHLLAALFWIGGLLWLTQI